MPCENFFQVELATVGIRMGSGRVGDLPSLRVTARPAGAPRGMPKRKTGDG